MKMRIILAFYMMVYKLFKHVASLNEVTQSNASTRFLLLLLNRLNGTEGGGISRRKFSTSGNHTALKEHIPNQMNVQFHSVTYTRNN